MIAQVSAMKLNCASVLHYYIHQYLGIGTFWSDMRECKYTSKRLTQSHSWPF